MHEEHSSCPPGVAQASIYDVVKMSEEERAALGFLVLVMRLWPRGISWDHVDVWLPDAGPSRELLEGYHLDAFGWDEFARRYRREQLAQEPRVLTYKVGKGRGGERNSTLTPLQLIQQLRNQHGQVTLLCHETTGHCHRFEAVALVNSGEGLFADGTAQTVLAQQHGVRGKDPRVPLLGERHGPFAVVGEDGWWKLYHMETGLSLCHMVGKGGVVECALALRTLAGADWSFTRPEEFLATAASPVAHAIVQDYEQRDGWVFQAGNTKTHHRYREPS